MALTTNEMSAADIAAVTGANNGWGGNDSGWWLILLFLFAFNNNGWGNGNNNGNGGFGGYGYTPYPYFTSDVQRGFDQSAVMNGITALQGAVNTGFGDTALGIAGINQNMCNSFSQAEIAANARQIANMNQNFASQTALMGQLNNMAMAQQESCCENRAGIADLKYTVATENCADRTQSLENTRDIIESNNRNTQAIIDKLCALELDGVKNQLAQAQRENVGLQNQINMANYAASQANQTAAIEENLYTRLKNCPVPSMPVYGNVPIFQCQPQNNNCGCGVGVFN